MEWSKYIVEDKYFGYTSLVAFMLILVGFYTSHLLIFFIATIYFVIFLANNIYLKFVGHGFTLLNEKERQRHFIGEAGKWTFIFENSGLPIMRGEMRIIFDQSVAPQAQVIVDQKSSKYEIKVPFSINRGQRQIVTIPYTAKKRGLSKIRKIEIYIPHFFGFGETVLEYKPFIKKEALVYPVPMTVKNIENFLSFRAGESNVNHSLYEDLLSPAGTRDYLFSDSFNRVHWKASARKQTLQTKVYDKVAEKGLHLSLNIGIGYSITGHLEQLLSSAARLAYFSIKEDIPLSLSINMRVIGGGIPFCYIPVGTGKAHLQKVLEALAVVDNHCNLYPPEKMLSFYHRHLPVQPYLIHGGLLTDKIKGSLLPIEMKGIKLFSLETGDQHSVIQSMHLNVKRGELG